MKLGGTPTKLGGTPTKLGGTPAKLGGPPLKLGGTRGSIMDVRVTSHSPYNEGSWLHE
jgi:hypothetical protein